MNTTHGLKRVQAMVLTYLARAFLLAGDTSKADEAMTHALTLAAQMKDGLSQLTILKMLTVQNAAVPDKLEKIAQYQAKRREELVANVNETLSSDAHAELAGWDAAPS
jgi:hypothetical protein